MRMIQIQMATERGGITGRIGKRLLTAIVRMKRGSREGRQGGLSLNQKTSHLIRRISNERRSQSGRGKEKSWEMRRRLSGR